MVPGNAREAAPVNLSEAIQEKYPQAVQGRDWQVQDDGNGPYVSLWNLADAKPTADHLSSAWLAVLKRHKRAEMHAAFARECQADFGPTPWIAVGVLASSPTDARITALKARATKLRDRLASVDAAASVADVEAVRW